MSFDYKKLVSDLSRHFAQAANPHLLRRIAFEEGSCDRRGGQPTFDMRVAKVLYDNVPNLEPHVLLVAMDMKMPNVGEMGHGLRKDYDPKARDLFNQLRTTYAPFLSAAKNPELCQVLMAVQIVNMEDVRTLLQGKRMAPVDSIRGFIEPLSHQEAALKSGETGAPQLEALFRQDVKATAQMAKDKFDALHGRKPGGPAGP